MDFIKILGFSSFSELSRSSLLKYKIEREKLLIDMDKRAIKANFVEIELLNGDGRDITLVELTNVIELKNSVSELKLNYEPIYLDVNIIAKEMGLSVEDYKLYLNSFINQSIVDYNKLLKGDDKAIKNLSTLALTLKIPQINLLLLKIKNLPKEERISYIDEYYTKLTLLTLREVEEREVDKFNNFPVIEPDIQSISTSSNIDRLDSKFTDVIGSIDKMEKSTPPPKSKSDKSYNSKPATPKISDKIEKSTPAPKSKSKKGKSSDKFELDFGDDFSEFENLLNDLDGGDDLIPLKDKSKSISKVKAKVAEKKVELGGRIRID